MFSLQTALDARLATLKKKKVKKDQDVMLNDVSHEYIKKSLRQAGIINTKGEVVKRVTS
ncbi:hypothetical protein L4174_014755 [Photobacterium sp. CCB-ST2H9]|uniref:hypothetical protein n=1 Tax=Photobacterium sp. CCB-ST2H9 TaxID=2912855 RepID=UPI0020047AD3|nr:hypothetical protein [Photobacterium sp. CCB-ST2H9]UTM57041.1 hypothetical protein L4174_014755 [Photobacterium sp. CCB-ST2H9]